MLFFVPGKLYQTGNSFTLGTVLAPWDTVSYASPDTFCLPLGMEKVFLFFVVCSNVLAAKVKCFGREM